MGSIGESYELIGRILAKLILGGLRRQDLSPTDVLINGADNREDVIHFIDTMIWLTNEGILTHAKPLMDGTYLMVQLTSKGITLAERKEFDKGDRSIREVVETEPTGGLSSSIYGKIGAFIGGALGGFTKAIS